MFEILLDMVSSMCHSVLLLLRHSRLTPCSFWSYHLSKQALSVDDESNKQQALKILLCGGLAGVVTWASIFPLGTCLDGIPIMVL